MDKRKKQLMWNIILFVTSISIAFIFVKVGLIDWVVSFFGKLSWVGVFFSGIFFTSIFTMPPALVLIVEFAKTTPLVVLAVFGGAGAVVGDYIIFRFVKDKVIKDFEYILSFPESKRISVLFKTRLPKFFITFIGAIIIASPLPDEIGVSLLGISNVNNKVFLMLSFILNGLGILSIGLIEKATIVF